jgi:hypothetical protein
MSDRIRHAINRKIDALKAEEARLVNDLLNQEKEISRLQSQLVARMEQAAARKVEVQNHIARLRAEIEAEHEGGMK